MEGLDLNSDWVHCTAMTLCHTFRNIVTHNAYPYDDSVRILCSVCPGRVYSDMVVFLVSMGTWIWNTLWNICWCYTFSFQAHLFISTGCSIKWYELPAMRAVCRAIQFLTNNVIVTPIKKTDTCANHLHIRSDTVHQVDKFFQGAHYCIHSKRLRCMWPTLWSYSYVSNLDVE